VDREANTDEAVYAFFHPTFQEYFAACAITDWDFFLNHVPDNPKQGIYRIFEPQWKEVILLWLGRKELSKKQKEEFIQSLLEFQDECIDLYGLRCYFLAAAGIAEFKDCSLCDEIVSSIIALGYGRLNEEQQQWITMPEFIARSARIALQESDRQRVSHHLGAIQDICKDDNANFMAAMTLAGFDLEELTKTLSNNSNSLNNLTDNDLSEQVRLSIQQVHTYQNEIALLHEISFLEEYGAGNQEAIKALIDLLDNSWQNQSIYQQIAISLGRIGIGYPEAVNALIRIANLSQDEETQGNVAFSLGQIGTGYPEAVNTLIKLLDSQDEETCLNAASSLARIGMSYPEAINKSVYVLIKLLHSCQNINILLQLPYKLEVVLSDSFLPKAVTELKEYLKNEVNGNNFDIFHIDRFKACYQIIWHCAKNLPYPDFYQAWQQTTIHQRG
jgi:HEAT repeat protein